MLRRSVKALFYLNKPRCHRGSLVLFCCPASNSHGLQTLHFSNAKNSYPLDGLLVDSVINYELKGNYSVAPHKGAKWGSDSAYYLQIHDLCTLSRMNMHDLCRPHWFLQGD